MRLVYGHVNPDHANRAFKFIENKGQWSSETKFLADVTDGQMFLQRNSIGFVFRDGQSYDNFMLSNHPGYGEDFSNFPKVDIDYHAVRMSFVGARGRPQVIGSKPYTETRNYYLGNDESRWATGVKSYQEITYQDLYEGIDLHVAQKDGYYKYEYRLDADVDYHQIQVQFDGATKLQIEDGHLIIGTSVNQMTDAPPIAWQDVNGRRIDIPCHYELKGNILTFAFDKRPRRGYPLIIDPKLIFSTCSGSTADNWGNTACLDSDGSLYSGGTIFQTSSSGFGTPDPSGFPATPGAIQVTHQGGITDIGILKFDSSGANLLYACYLGGSGTDVPTSSITNENGDLFILAVTGSPDFPGAVNTFSGGDSINPGTGYGFNDGSDIVIIKLRTDGSNAIVSRYMGGTANDGLTGGTTATTNNYGDQFRGEIILDGVGDVYVATVTASNDFPTLGNLDTTYNGGDYDGIVFKMEPAVLAPLWCGYIGGANTDAAYSIQIDAGGNAIVAGGTNSTDFQMNGMDTVLNGGVDGFVVKIPLSGDTISASTYIGTDQFDQCYFVQLDEFSNVYLFGQTHGAFPVTPGIYNDPLSGQFIAKLDNTLSNRLFSFTFGSSAADSNSIRPNISPTAFLVNDCGNMFVSGWGGVINSCLTGICYSGGVTQDMPLTNDLAVRTTSDGNDFYLAAFREGGVELIFGTYYGGEFSRDHVDGGTSRFDPAGIVYQSVCAGCQGFTDFPTFPDDGSPLTYPMRNQSGNCNNGVFKFDLAFLEAAFTLDQESCLDKTIDFTNESIGGILFNWNFGDGQFFDTTTATNVSHTYEDGGVYTITLTATDFATCIGLDQAEATIVIIDSVAAFKDTIICLGESVQLTAEHGYPMPLWDIEPGGMSCFQCDTIDVTPTGPTWYVARSIGSPTCQHADSVFVDMHPQEKGVNEIGFNAPRCHDDPVTFLGGVRDNDCICCKPVNQWTWYFGDGETYVGQEPSHTYPEGGIYQVILETITADTLYDTTYVEVYVSDSCLKNIYIPNAFTPNDDGSNDLLFVRGINIIELDFHLYDRLGEEVFQTTSLLIGWDGVYNNEHMAPQVFVYTCEATFWDGSVVKKEGNITLLD